MRRVRFAVAAVTVVFVAGGVLSTVAGAGGPPPEIDLMLDDDQLDQLRELIPEGFPGEYDEEEADAFYDEVLGVVGPAATAEAEIGSQSKLTGPCGGFALSYDKNGALIDAAADGGTGAPPVDVIDGGQAMTSSNRFKVDTEGLVVYYGFMPRAGNGPEDHRWKIATGGISLDSGGDPNPKFKNRAVGIVDLAEDLPVKFNANTTVKGDLKSNNLPPCIGEGHIEFRGPIFGPIGIAALALFGGGILGLLFNARPAMTFKA